MLAGMERVTASGPTLIVTDDPDLLEQLLRLCAASSVTPDVIGDPAAARRTWWQAPCVLVGEDRADEVARLDLGRRPDVVLVAAGPESTQVWRRGVAIRADHVAVLPQAQAWLVERLTDSIDGSAGVATVLGVIGARGGAGASTLAAALASSAARRGGRPLLVDADPLGGGIELVLGCEGVPGLRWPEVASTQGRVSAVALRAALPEVGDVAVLSWDRGDTTTVDPSTMRAMLAAGQRGAGLVVIDLPRRLDDPAVDAVTMTDTLLLVCPTDVRAAAAAGRLLGGLRTLCADLRLVVRETRGSDVTADALADTLRLPLAATIPTTRGLDRAVNEGLGPVARGRLASRCSRLLDALSVPGLDQ